MNHANTTDANNAATAEQPIRLTQYSHGAGCGCKIAPSVLSEILESNWTRPEAKLLVGNDVRDDAAVYDLGGGQALISTTDFFMPIVDDPYQFGSIAAANALSDVYAMGGRPILALSLLGWPVEKLPTSAARGVIEGARAMCAEAGASIGGGHSIDSPEPIFGLAANGLVQIEHIKRNSAARAGDLLYLTKPLGIGILTTAEKKGLLKAEHRGLAAEWMLRLNKIGERLGRETSVRAMTDVTGFGLLGHLSEVCEASGVSAKIQLQRVPQIADLAWYLERGSVPGGSGRNHASYGDRIASLPETAKNILCDPQTSGGLLLAVDPQHKTALESILDGEGLGEFARPIGELQPPRADGMLVEVV